MNAKYLFLLLTLISSFSCDSELEIPTPEEPDSFLPDPNTICGAQYYQCYDEARDELSKMYQVCSDENGFGGMDYYSCITESNEAFNQMLDSCKEDFNNCSEP